MHNVISTSEVLGTYDQGRGEMQVCATGDAQFDEDRSKLVMDLNSFVRPADPCIKEEHLSADWLPQPQHVEEKATRQDAGAVARDIFRRWVHRIRDTVPLYLHN